MAVHRFGPALARLARGYEADGELARDLEQEMHVALWRSLERFRREAELSTWVWRVAHNTGAKHVQSATRQKRHAPLVPIEDVELASDQAGPEVQTDKALKLKRLYGFIHALEPLDRQVMLLYLEDVDAAAIGEVTGLSPGSVATRIHRIKAALSARFETGDTP
ncbi:RNA polymerase sigma factor [Pelagibacterium sp.]|uniref:RNA polymerase sigma factor n=1 Tax=Pelagibacterium sp. TaxID=1967288 RepID=UPI003A8CAFB6